MASETQMTQNEQSIRACLTAEENRFYRFRLYDAVPSTNTLLKTEAETCPEGTVVLAGQQTAGRGRLGRSFYSPFGTGVYMSVLVKPDMPCTDALFLTTDTAVAVSESIESLTGRSASVKWVNDVYLDKKKVCGILCEAAFSADMRSLAWAVIGIGVNTAPPEGGFPPELADIVTAVSETGAVDRYRLAGEILHRLYPMLADPGNREWRERYRSRSLLDGKAVRVRKAGASADTASEIPAVCLYIDETCGLRVRYTEGVLAGTEETLTSGEVSVHLE